ncbi:MAG: HyaD/HybD family hydrogenase maturation endopeptidase, partial [Rhodospirillales bacterium]|nr:HyaD/HybD family hydrogenase maturation endopeptidase [Rhodospirillales bacterium]
MRVVVLGVGNILLSDEGVGVRAVEALQEAYAFPPEVEVLDGGTLGMELLDPLAGADHLIIADCIKAGQTAGTLLRYAGDQVPAFFRTKISPHQVGMSDVLATLKLMGQEPGSVTLHGIQPASMETGMELTSLIAERLPALVQALAADIQALGFTVLPQA